MPEASKSAVMLPWHGRDGVTSRVAASGIETAITMTQTTRKMIKSHGVSRRPAALAFPGRSSISASDLAGGPSFDAFIHEICVRLSERILAVAD